jgi:Uma2 family endonuclease
MQLPAQRMSVAGYLEIERRTRLQYEYVDGEIYAMAGASRRHNLLAGNLFGHAWQARSSHECRIFSQAMKLQVAVRNSFYYPDVVGSCDPEDGADGPLTQPCFVIEVLSDSTSGIDRREKRLAYLTLKSLDEYVIVDQYRMHVSVYRGARGPWASQVLDAPDDVLKLTCVNVGIALKDIYEGVDFPKDEVRSDRDVPEYGLA